MPRRLFRSRFPLSVLTAAAGLLCGGTWALADHAVSPIKMVITEANKADAAAVAGWKREGYGAVVLVLDEGQEASAFQKAGKRITQSGLDLYLWIEVARNPAMAREHPEWLAALGMHDDWRKRFPKVRPLEKGEVAKAWPWVPIVYREALDAHKTRVQQLLARAPKAYRGILLNDLQGGPASCGCGNLQCRWAVDYNVPSTATKLTAADTAARFVNDIRKLTNGKEVIPVWTPECEAEDLPRNHRLNPGWSTGYCGTVPCLETCRKRFADQWAALLATHPGPVAALLLHREFARERKEYGGPAAWISQATDSLTKGPARLPRQRLWVVVQGYDVTSEEQNAACRLAANAGAAAIVVAQARLDQSYEPRIVPAKARRP
jgi:hypothetical protein